MEILQRLQSLDIQLFERLFRHSSHRTVILLAKSFSLSGGGILHFAVPLLLFSLGIPDSGRFFITLVVAVGIERGLYLVTAPDKFSFPSGHTSASFLLATVVSVSYGGIFAGMFIWAAAVALSRVLLGVHFPGDTLAGALMGVVVGGLTTLALGMV